ncbi:hypothetical protein AHF37_07613 [Paragonimus kellicotti]|nr:hypothetical protein AHF37_07613 [Paragonimus kellicotti]
MLERFRCFLRPSRRSFYGRYLLITATLVCIGIWGSIEYGRQTNIVSTEIKRTITTAVIKNNKVTENPIQDTYMELAEAVRNATLHSWKAYTQCAWGKDEVKPLSCTGTEWMQSLLTMIDALDTFWIMDLNLEYTQIRHWISYRLHFNTNNDHINVFETTIRILGGLLSAYTLSQDEMFLNKAKLLGSILIKAFKNNSALPMTDLNWATKTATLPSWTHHHLSLAEVSTLQLEFNELSKLTKNEIYALLGARIYEHLRNLPKLDGLLPISLDSDDGSSVITSAITLGAKGDSYYEYLLKVWVQTGKVLTFLKDEFEIVIRGVEKHLVRLTSPSGFLFIGELYDGKNFRPKMDHLVCFLPGTLAYGVYHGLPPSHLVLAEKLMRSCYEMYNFTNTHLSPEIVYFSTERNAETDIQIQPADRHSLLRPEVMESLFFLYYVTRNPIYREWGKKIFQAFEKYAKLPVRGYAGLLDVTDPKSKHIDKMDSFWLAETLKYAYLLFNETAAMKLPFTKWVFNTEGHPLPVSETATFISNIYDKYNRI